MLSLSLVPILCGKVVVSLDVNHDGELNQAKIKKCTLEIINDVEQ